MKVKKLSRGVFAAAVGAVAAFGLFCASADEASAARRGPCGCVYIFKPVICDGGVIHGNACFADCAGATGCEPLLFPS